MLKKTANLFTTAYLLIMFAIYPFYMQNGYVDIGEAKNHFFLYVSIAAFGILGLLAVIYLCVRLKEICRQKRAYLIDWDRVSSTDLLVLLYATTIFMSYVFSEHQEEALWGTEGWYIGTVMLLLLCGLYFFISRMWNANVKVLYAPVTASIFVFLLGISNRFSFYPISFEIVQPGFISTLGNINWYCGYLSVIAPVGIVMFVLSDDKKQGKMQKAGQKWKQFGLGVYSVITFMTAFSQGSSSIFLWFIALFFMLLWICVEKRKWFQNWILLVVLWGASAQLVRLMRNLMPGRYNYDADNLCGYFTGSSLALWIALAGAAGYIYLVITEKRSLKEPAAAKMQKQTGRKILLICAGVLSGLLILIMAINAKWGIPFLKENAAFGQIFLLDEAWGNGRGAAFYAGIRVFNELSLLHKMLGTGPDCFSIYVYSMPELAMKLRESFGSVRLTNAHCELLTGLVNTGILGVLFYLGIIISFVRRCMKRAKENAAFYIFATCAVCYLIHNMISFAQVLNLPFLFILMGMGEAFERYPDKLDKS